MDLDDDFLDGCSLDFKEDPDDLETQELRPLFPDGVADPDLVDSYRRLALPLSDDVPNHGEP